MLENKKVLMKAFNLNSLKGFSNAEKFKLMLENKGYSVSVSNGFNHITIKGIY